MATYPVAVHVKAKDSASDVIARTSRRIGRSLSDVRRNATSASSAISSVGSTIREGTSRALLYGVGAIGAGFVGAGIAAKSWAENALEVSGELVDFRAKTGFAIEALQEWRYAAEQSGVETGTFNSAVMNLSKQLAGARDGTGKLATFTAKSLNPALLEQIKTTTTTEEAVGLYIAALEGIPDPSRRAAAAQQIFGRAGKDMAALASAGAVEIQRLRDEKRKDGLMSTDAAEKAEALGDQVSRLKGRYSTFTTVIGTKFLEALSPHLDGLGQWFDRNQQVIGQNVAGGVEWLAEAFSSVDWDAIASGATTVWSALEKIGAGASEAYANMRELYVLGEELGDKAAGTYDDLKSGLAGLIGVSAEDTGADGAPTALGGNTRVTSLEAKQRAAERFAPTLAMFGQGDIAANVAREAEAIQSVRALYARRVEVRESGMTRDGGGIAERVRAAGVQQRTTAERLGSLPYGLAPTAGPPEPPQEITIKVESAPGTEATVTKQPKASNVKVGTRRVGTGGL